MRATLATTTTATIIIILEPVKCTNRFKELFSSWESFCSELAKFCSLNQVVGNIMRAWNCVFVQKPFRFLQLFHGLSNCFLRRHYFFGSFFLNFFEFCNFIHTIHHPVMLTCHFLTKTTIRYTGFQAL